MKNFTLFFAALFAILLTSCQKEALHELPTANNNDLTTQTVGTPLNVSPKKNIAQYLQDDTDFKLFYEALVHSNLASFVTSSNITVFAPNNSAMQKLLQKGNYTMIQEIQPNELKQIMMCHISVTGQHVLDSNERGKDVEILHENQTVYMKTTDGTIHYGNMKTNIYVANQQQTNGVIHKISNILLPQ